MRRIRAWWAAWVAVVAVGSTVLCTVRQGDSSTARSPEAKILVLVLVLVLYYTILYYLSCTVLYLRLLAPRGSPLLLGLVHSETATCAKQPMPRRSRRVSLKSLSYTLKKTGDLTASLALIKTGGRRAHFWLLAHGANQSDEASCVRLTATLSMALHDFMPPVWVNAASPLDAKKGSRSGFSLCAAWGRVPGAKLGSRRIPEVNRAAVPWERPTSERTDNGNWVQYTVWIYRIRALISNSPGQLQGLAKSKPQ